MNSKTPIFVRLALVLTLPYLIACSTTSGVQAPVSASADANVTEPVQAQAPVADKDVTLHEPLLTHGQYRALIVSLDRKNRRFTLKLSDGQRVRLIANNKVGDLDHLKAGEHVVVTLSAQAVVYADLYLHPDTGHVMDMPAPGSSQERENYNPYFHHAPSRHHQSHATHDYLDVAGEVVQIDRAGHAVSINTDEHKAWTVSVQEYADKISVGDSVILRFTEMDAIMLAETHKHHSQHASRQKHHGASHD